MNCESHCNHESFSADNAIAVHLFDHYIVTFLDVNIGRQSAGNEIEIIAMLAQCVQSPFQPYSCRFIADSQCQYLTNQRGVNVFCHTVVVRKKVKDIKVTATILASKRSLSQMRHVCHEFYLARQESGVCKKSHDVPTGRHVSTIHPIRKKTL